MAKRLSKAERAALNSRMDAEWRKERKRIMDAGRRLKQRGFTLDADFVPAKKMKRHDQRILDSLKKFRGDDLYKKLSFTAKGKTVHGKRAKAFEKEVRRQNIETPTIDPFANLKDDLNKLYQSLYDSIDAHDWGYHQSVFDSMGKAIDILNKIDELKESIDGKFASLNADAEGQKYYEYILSKMNDINMCLQDAATDSDGSRILGSIDKAINIILQGAPREFDSEEYSDYGLSNEDVDFGEELPY